MHLITNNGCPPKKKKKKKKNWAFRRHWSYYLPLEHFHGWVYVEASSSRDWNCTTSWTVSWANSAPPSSTEPNQPEYMGLMLMQQIQPANAGPQSKPCNTCWWDAHSLNLNECSLEDLVAVSERLSIECARAWQNIWPTDNWHESSGGGGGGTSINREFSIAVNGTSGT